MDGLVGKNHGKQHPNNRMRQTVQIVKLLDADRGLPQVFVCTHNSKHRRSSPTCLLERMSGWAGSEGIIGADTNQDTALSESQIKFVKSGIWDKLKISSLMSTAVAR